MAALPALARAARYGDVRGTDSAPARGRRPDAGADLRRVCRPRRTTLDDDAAALCARWSTRCTRRPPCSATTRRTAGSTALAGLIADRGLPPLLAGQAGPHPARRRPVWTPATSSCGSGRVLTAGVEPVDGRGLHRGLLRRWRTAAGARRQAAAGDRRLAGGRSRRSSSPRCFPCCAALSARSPAPERRAIGERAAGLTGRRRRRKAGWPRNSTRNGRRPCCRCSRHCWGWGHDRDRGTVAAVAAGARRRGRRHRRRAVRSRTVSGRSLAALYAAPPDGAASGGRAGRAGRVGATRWRAGSATSGATSPARSCR